MKRCVGLASIVVLSLSGCGSDGPGSAATVGSAGGEVSGASGARVSIPAGALASATSITAAAAASAPTPAGTTVVGSAVTFGPEGQQFSVPVTVTLPFSPSLLPAGKNAESVVVYTAPVGSSTYTALATSVVDATHVAAKVSHFSSFVPAVAGGCTSNADCVHGTCVSGTCVQGGGCMNTQDCSPGQNCVNNMCQ